MLKISPAPAQASIKQPSDVGGATAANRLDYQKNWALSKIIELVKENKVFTIIFDYYDDVLIFEPKSSDKVDFYQIKSKRGPEWTTNALLQRKSKKSYSKLGKLRYAKENYSDLVSTLNFVSNAGYKILLTNGTKCGLRDKTCLSELAKEQRELIEKKLSMEFGNAKVSIIEDAFLHNTTLGIDGHSEQTLGNLANLFEELYPKTNYRPKSLYDTISAEIRRRNNLENTYSTKEALFNAKGLSSEQFRSMLGQFGGRRDIDKEWEGFNQILIAEGWVWKKLRNLKDAWNKWWLAINDPSATSAMELSARVHAVVSTVGHPEKLSELLSSVVSLFQNITKERHYSEFDISALVLLNLDETTKQLPPAHSSSKNETL